MDNYDDIINLSRPQYDDFPPMPIRDRAAQFLPFAALRGFDEMIAESTRQTERKIELSEDAVEEIDRKLRQLLDLTNKGYSPNVKIVYFVPDKTKPGGKYENFSGKLKAIDRELRKLIFYDAENEMSLRTFDIDSLFDIDGKFCD